MKCARSNSSCRGSKTKYDKYNVKWSATWKWIKGWPGRVKQQPQRSIWREGDESLPSHRRSRGRGREQRRETIIGVPYLA
jgi:hypothetical protein